MAPTPMPQKVTAEPTANDPCATRDPWSPQQSGCPGSYFLDGCVVRRSATHSSLVVDTDQAPRRQRPRAWPLRAAGHAQVVAPGDLRCVSRASRSRTLDSSPAALLDCCSTMRRMPSSRKAVQRGQDVLPLTRCIWRPRASEAHSLQRTGGDRRCDCFGGAAGRNRTCV